MRNLLAAGFSAVFGVALAVPGVVLALWVGLTVYRMESGFDWIYWALEHSPFTLSATPLVLANQAVQSNALIPTGVLALFLCWIGFSTLRRARDAVRPADESSGGKAKIALKTAAPRVGLALEGSLRLLQDPTPGQVFRLELTCDRTYRPPEGKARTETAFFAEQDVAAVQDAEGWGVPFRFDVPVTAPHTGAAGSPGNEVYGWRLAFYPADGVIAFPSSFALSLGAAPAEELRAAQALETPEQKAAIEEVSQELGRFRDPLLPHEREQLRSLSPADLAMAKKVAAMPAKMMTTVLKWFLILFFALPLLAMLLMLAVGALM